MSYNCRRLRAALSFQGSRYERFALCLPGVIPCREFSSASPRLPLSLFLAGPSRQALISETLIRLNVMPAPAPKPALRYRLLPELKEMNPGNPIQHYMKTMMEQKTFFFDEEAFQHREKLLAMPLKELPVQELSDYGRYALSQADWAARLDNPDWQILLKLRADGIELLASRGAADPLPGQGASGAVSGRDRPEPLRRRHPNRQDDVRHVAPPGRAPDAHWRPGGDERSLRWPPSAWTKCWSSQAAPTFTGR